uniref:Uncharacterized protein n=1 Tax=Macrostomum lignano TaxID=282301 RepID=A0A1I8ITI2_9PLAT
MKKIAMQIQISRMPL